MATRLVVNREGCKCVLRPFFHQLLLSPIQEEEKIDLVEEISQLFNNSLFLIFPDGDNTQHAHNYPRLSRQEPMASDRAKPCELDQEKYDADDNVKIICLGDSAVGKSKYVGS